jgi:peptide-methionine (R)-S-oxide reductase
MDMNRRTFLLGSTALGAIAALAPWSSNGAEGKFEFTLPDAEWRKRLTPAQYSVLRQANTERAGSSPLDKEYRKGIFACAGCELPLFRSETKFDSHTGWPSFYAPIDNAVGTAPDRQLLLFVQTEVHCSRCGGHLGHVFDDGPKPTGKRYCMNGVALKFLPA